MTGYSIRVHSNTIEATVNSILREWRDLWPGGLDERRYSTLNLMAHCREGSLGFNQAKCRGCNQREWYASSCGDRHCPNCLGPRQGKWAEKVCQRLPDCPHFHLVFTIPEQLHDVFESNYRLLADALTSAAADTIKQFQKNNWKMEGGFLSVLHTWGSSLNWHPHLHVLVAAGGIDPVGDRWKTARSDYSFPVRCLSAVFRACLLARLERLESEREMQWPKGWTSVEERRKCRIDLASRNFNVFSKATLGNTRAVVRYLARYTSRIAMSNSRITHVDSRTREVGFRWKDYRDDGRVKERRLPGKTFLWLLSRHLVPKGYRRVRYFGWLTSGSKRLDRVGGIKPGRIAERTLPVKPPACKRCKGTDWDYLSFFRPMRIPASPDLSEDRFSLVTLRAGP